MAYPSPPEISTSYTAQEQALGDGTLPGQELDVDLASIRASVTAVIEFVKQITRSDGKLANGIVTQEALGAALIIGFDPPSVWATGVAYTTRSIVFEGTKIYLCLAAHTSSVFATDLASGRWSLLADLAPVGGALVASNNLSDLPDKPNARANLGLGSMATAVAGTGAAQFRTNLQNEAFFQPLAAGLTSWAAIARAAGFDTFAATPSSANLRALLTDETGSGALLFAGGAMGTPSSLDLTNASGLTTAGIAAGSLTTAAETIAANNVDTQVPTSAAVKAYVDANAGAAYYLAITADQTWNKPAGFSADQIVTFEAWGGGGGGGRTTTAGAGGGGGGGYVRREMRYADVPSSVSVTIGAGGAGRSGSAGDGTTGGDTSCGTLVTAYGGGGGQGVGTAPALGGGGGGELAAGNTSGVGGAVGGGSGGSTAAAVAAGTIWGGGGGGNGAANGGRAVHGGGGGGGAASNSGWPGGASLYGGNGGAGSASAPVAGAAPGGGGGAGTNNTNGAAGARGEVRIRIG